MNCSAGVNGHRRAVVPVPDSTVTSEHGVAVDRVETIERGGDGHAGPDPKELLDVQVELVDVGQPVGVDLADLNARDGFVSCRASVR